MPVEYRSKLMPVEYRSRKIIAILAAAALKLDVSRGLAIGVLALIAVLPEYAVDFTFAYKAEGSASCTSC